MKNMRIYWGETLPVLVDVDNFEALTATLIINTSPQITKTANFVEGEADVSIPADETQVTPGQYQYQVNVTYSNGDIKKFPDISICDGCSLPYVTILESLDMPGVS
jgi:hypothetical protein